MIISETGGRFTINTKNLLDHVVSVEDALGSIATYEYDVFGNLIKFTDPSGNSMTMTYNLNGQKLSKNDSTTGYSTYRYNAFNELMYSRNANGTEIRFERDRLGRMTRRVEPEGMTTWTYDTALNGVGYVARIESTTSGSRYSIEIKYNTRGLPIEKTVRYNTTVYTLGTAYDKLGRVITQVYPNGESVYVCYNKFGYLEAISAVADDSTCSQGADWQVLAYNAQGSVVREKYGNQLVNEYTYAESSQLERVTTAQDEFASTYLRRIDYEYDKRQNLAQRTMYDETGRVSVLQKFGYDVLNRLTFASSYEQQATAAISSSSGGSNTSPRIRSDRLQLTESSSWMYDGMGNIMSYQDASGQKLYNYDERARQQAVQIGNERVEYDALGNVKSTDAYRIDWYSFSKARTITPTGAAGLNQSAVTFVYGPDRELVSKVIGNPRSTLTTTIHFVDDLYEQWTVRNGSVTTIVEKFHVRAVGRIISTRIRTRIASSSSSSSQSSNRFVNLFFLCLYLLKKKRYNPRFAAIYK